MLEREEYVEQAYCFRVLSERIRENLPLQDLLSQAREEVLSTTKLPLALDFLLAELRHRGVCAEAMQRLNHYFTPFQAYLMREAESERGRFDIRVALEVLRDEAAYRGAGGSRAGVFLYQFETLCRNRLRYDPGLAAIADDPIYDEDWRDWILTARRQIGLVDFADMIYVRSEHYLQRRNTGSAGVVEAEKPVLFGEKEGKIALANRHKDPLYLFAALQRHLGYPVVPRRKPVDDAPNLLPQVLRRLERLETRLKLLEDEQRGGIDITQFYGLGAPPPGDENSPS